MTEDRLSLNDAKEILRYGATRLWTYTANGLTYFVATKGINIINHIDYIMVYTFKKPMTLGYDFPERFSLVARQKMYKKIRETLDTQN